MQFIPIIERTTPDLLSVANEGWGETVKDRPLYIQDGDLVTDRSIAPEGYGRFLIDVFEDWKRRDIGEVYVQMFDVALANWFGEPPGSACILETCGLALTMEHTGDLYSCDHFVEPDYQLGNIREDRNARPLIVLPQQKAFGRAKRDTLPHFCLDCDVRFACHGGCPKDRFTTTPDGEDGLHYLCPSYKDFFGHIRSNDGRDVRPAASRQGAVGARAGLPSRGRRARPQRAVHLRLRPQVEALSRRRRHSRMSIACASRSRST